MASIEDARIFRETWLGRADMRETNRWRGHNLSQLRPARDRALVTIRTWKYYDDIRRRVQPPKTLGGPYLWRRIG